MATNISWPDSLPLPMEADYTIRDVDSRVASSMEAGQFLRRQFASREADCTGELLMTKKQAKAFETFFDSELDYGASWFRMPLYNHGTIRWYWVQFAEMPEYKVAGGVWTRISFHLKLSYANAEMYKPTSSYYNLLHHVLHDVAPECTKIPSGVMV